MCEVGSPSLSRDIHIYLYVYIYMDISRERGRAHLTHTGQPPYQSFPAVPRPSSFLPAPWPPVSGSGRKSRPCHRRQRGQKPGMRENRPGHMKGETRQPSLWGPPRSDGPMTKPKTGPRASDPSVPLLLGVFLTF